MRLKLFGAYGLYNIQEDNTIDAKAPFQSSLELTGYITGGWIISPPPNFTVSKLFRAYGLYDKQVGLVSTTIMRLQSSLELTGYITTRLSRLRR